MAILMMETDAFEEAFRGQVAGKGRRAAGVGKSYDRHRRPTGLVPKYSGAPRPAYLKVVGQDGQSIWLYEDPGSPRGRSWETSSDWTDFSLQSVQESRREKVQLVETFGESYTFFSGEHARILNCNGVLVNSASHNWRASFWANYDKYFRGTKLVERNARVYLSWDDIIVQGYMLSANASETADQPHAIPFSFALLLVRYDNVSMHTEAKGATAKTKREAGEDSFNRKEFLAGKNEEFSKLLPTQADRDALSAALLASGVHQDQIDLIMQVEGASPVLMNRLAMAQAQRGFLSRFGDALLSKVSVNDMIGIAKGLWDDPQTTFANVGISSLEAASEVGSSTAGAALPYAVGAKGISTLEGVGLASASGEVIREMFGYDKESGEFKMSAFTAGAGSIAGAISKDVAGTVAIPGSSAGIVAAL